MEYAKNALITFVKKPILGKAKTRLAATVGDEKALQIYIRLLEHTQEICSLAKADSHVFYAFDIVEDDMWNDAVKHLQVDGDLGDRMSTAFETLFKSGYDNVVIIGSDCAELNPDIVQTAFIALEENDVVIGPALDGGYYLLGMNQFLPQLFKDVAWSTETVFEKTKVNAAGHSVALLETLSDVDYEEDLDRVPWLKAVLKE